MTIPSEWDFGPFRLSRWQEWHRHEWCLYFHAGPVTLSAKVVVPDRWGADLSDLDLAAGQEPDGSK